MNSSTSTTASQTLRKLSEKLVMFELFRDWISANHGLSEPYHITRQAPPDEAVFAYLLDQFGVRVNRDGSISLKVINSVVRKFLGGHSIIVYHHTSSALLESIREKGLVAGLHKVGRKADLSKVVFVTTERTGDRPALFSKRACDSFGGSPVALMCRVPFTDLRIDKDESDNSDWQMHHVVASVGAESIVNLEMPAAIAIPA